MKFISLSLIIVLLAACGSSSSHAPTQHSSTSSTTSSAGSSSSQAPINPSVTVLPSGVQEVSLTSGSRTLKLYTLTDDMIDVSYFTNNAAPTLNNLFSEMIAYKDFHGAQSFQQQGQTLTTAQFIITLDNNLCVSLTDLMQHTLNKTCPSVLGSTQFTLNIEAPTTTQAYGLGEQFFDTGSDASTRADWLGRVRTPGIDTGNRMVNFYGGQVGNLQIPVLLTYQPAHAVGYFLDSPHAQTWNLSQQNRWTITGYTNHFDLFIFAKDNFDMLRQQYMQLTGTPPVPPRTAFGLWISEFGFDNWAEADSKITAQRNANMPLDGLVLDLQWFGGINNHRMGSLTWDPQAFPDPSTHLKNWQDISGVSAITIEEPYVDSQVSDYSNLNNLHYLVRACKTCNSSFFNEWWGSGGMLDWSNKEGAAYWHSTKRTPLINAGIVGHWTDLGEPENFDPNGWYADTYNDLRHDQASIHNLYNFYWSKSIFDGYHNEQSNLRPWILSRSGTAGSQRFGATFWSGDVGSDIPSLAAHQQAQMHVSMSGYDYFGSDIGGFHRGNISANDFKNLYTLWFANSALFDIPLRAHTENLCNCKETAPSLAGDIPSNKYNLQQRYRLFPYYYSLAHQAYRTGTAIFPPITYYYPTDTAAIGKGNMKFIGPSLLARAFADPGQASVLASYVPAGNWLDWNNQTWLTSNGQLFNLSGTYKGMTTLPLLAKEGAIIPMMYVDDKTMNLKGQRTDNSQRNELIVRIIASANASQFTLYEDDGRSMGYQTGEVAQTLISQQLTGGLYTVTIAPTSGSYAGMATSRRYQVELFAMNGNITAAAFDGEPLTIAASPTEFDAMAQGAYKIDGGHWLAKIDTFRVDQNKQFTFSAQ